ncbi:MAG: hypothetical protein Q7U57_07355 [Methylovulum sp.]|nr:hypothetical protein [Methylovulum sp.]
MNLSKKSIVETIRFIVLHHERLLNLAKKDGYYKPGFAFRTLESSKNYLFGLTLLFIGDTAITKEIEQAEQDMEAITERFEQQFTIEQNKQQQAA